MATNQMQLRQGGAVAARMLSTLLVLLMLVQLFAPPTRVQATNLRTDISATTIALGFSAVGERQSDNLGYSVSRAGDVNGDGYEDVIVGAYGYNAPGANDAGKVYVYHGGPNGLSASPAFTALGEMADAYFGFAVATAGDVNGDGYADVLVGSYRYDDGVNRANVGKVYVLHGGPGGVTGTAATAPFSAVGELSLIHISEPTRPY